jgi:hypothetical protein
MLAAISRFPQFSLFPVEPEEKQKKTFLSIPFSNATKVSWSPIKNPFLKRNESRKQNFQN